MIIQGSDVEFASRWQASHLGAPDLHQSFPVVLDQFGQPSQVVVGLANGGFHVECLLNGGLSKTRTEPYRLRESPNLLAISDKDRQKNFTIQGVFPQF